MGLKDREAAARKLDEESRQTLGEARELLADVDERQRETAELYAASDGSKMLRWASEWVMRNVNQEVGASMFVELDGAGLR